MQPHTRYTLALLLLLSLSVLPHVDGRKGSKQKAKQKAKSAKKGAKYVASEHDALCIEPLPVLEYGADLPDDVEDGDPLPEAALTPALFGGALNRTRFYREHWGRRPLHSRREEEGVFAGLLTLEGLDDVIAKNPAGCTPTLNDTR
jgi:hypothetical protein